MKILTRWGLTLPAFVALIIYALLVLVGWALLSSQVPFPTLAGLAVSLLLGGLLPGTGIVRLVFDRPSVVHYVAIGTTVGLALWSFGGVLSHYADLDAIRWLPAIAGLALWIVPWRHRRVATTATAVFPMIALAGSAASLLGLIPAMITALRSQPVSWSGWYRFYPDIPFHIAITSEVAARAPEQASWVAGTTLSYTWLFHSAMGVWASMSGATSAAVVLQLWPVVFVGLIPLVISVIGWELTRSKWAAAAAPLLFVFMHGPVFAPALFVEAPLFQISPTRDFADVMILLALLCLVRLLSRQDDHVPRGGWLALLALSVFVATGAKGSALPILLGAVLSAGLYLLVSKRLRRRDFLTALVFVLAATISYFSVLPDPGLTNALTLQPLTFLTPATIHRAATSIELIAVLTLGAAGIWLTIGRSAPGRWVVSSLIGGLLAAGIVGLALTNYPGDSQLYFWESAQPVLSIALAWAGVILVGRFRWRIAVVIIIVVLGGGAMWIVSQRVWLTELAVGGVALAASIYFARAKRFRNTSNRPTSWSTTIVTILACAAVLVQGAQVISLPAGIKGGVPSKASDPSAVSSGQLAAFTYIRLHSTAEQEVITNKHCRTGTLSDGACDPRWFAVAAFTERPVLVDGWAYTQNGTSATWVQSRLDESDGFISHPTIAAERVLQSHGVKFVYVDTREPFSLHLGLIAREVFTGTGALVYELG